MRKLARIAAPIVCLVGLAACATTTGDRPGATEMQRPMQCMSGGEHCRWDNQCCSRRCYVDTGCSG